MNILVIDVGGTHVKILASGEKEKREIDSGPTLTARQMVSRIKRLADGWEFDLVSIGYPGPVVHDRPMAEPHNLGKGWMGFNFAAAFKLPTKVINDAAMQALGSYRSGKMLFLGLGTGLGSALIVDGSVIPMELGQLPYKDGTYETYLRLKGVTRLGITKWRDYVHQVVVKVMSALELDEVVIGGGNVTKLDQLPPGCRVGDNALAFRGGFLLSEKDGRPKSGAR